MKQDQPSVPGRARPCQSGRSHATMWCLVLRDKLAVRPLKPQQLILDTLRRRTYSTTHGSFLDLEFASPLEALCITILSTIFPNISSKQLVKPSTSPRNAYISSKFLVHRVIVAGPVAKGELLSFIWPLLRRVPHESSSKIYLLNIFGAPEKISSIGAS